MMKHFRRLSARGASALSCWRLSASRADLRLLFGPAADEAHSPRLLRVGPADAPWDEGVLWVGPDATAELHLHGGPGVAQALRAWLSAQGWQEEPPLAALVGLAPELPDEAEAELRFRQAESPRSARAWCEFRRQDGPRTLAEGASLRGPRRVDWARAQLQHAAWAEVLESPPTLVLAGPPNAGKSSLFNAWLRASRATVADAPGTTRDLVGERLSLDHGPQAWSLQILDTAGLWDGAAGTDLIAVQRTQLAIQDAWKVLWVLDAAIAPGLRLQEALRHARPADLFLLHRTDLKPGFDPASLPAGPWLRGSVLHEGESLLARLEAALVQSVGPQPDPAAWLPLGRSLRAQLRAWSEEAAPGG